LQRLRIAEQVTDRDLALLRLLPADAEGDFRGLDVVAAEDCDRMQTVEISAELAASHLPIEDERRRTGGH
jgi:hypothetical protein